MDRARRNQRYIGEATNVAYAPSQIAAMTTDISVTTQIPGAKVGDVALVTLATPTALIVCDAYVSGPSTITIRSTNVDPTNPHTPMATTASAMVFRLI